jgi:hypothetical protein
MKGDKIYYKEGYKYQLAQDYSIQVDIIPIKPIVTDWLCLSKTGMLTVKKGYAWDGPSGPTIDTSNSMRGSLVHDALYQLMRMEFIPESSRARADDLLHEICTEDGMNPVRADLWKEMVKLFAASCAKAGTEQPILEAPADEDPCENPVIKINGDDFPANLGQEV